MDNVKLKSDKNSANVIVVGGGISGLAATVKLHESGFKNVMLLEARNRLGGRIHSVTVSTGESETDDFTFEAGAQWIQEGLEEVFKKFPYKEEIQFHQPFRNLACFFEDELDITKSDLQITIAADEKFHDLFDGVDVTEESTSGQCVLSYLKNEWDKYVQDNSELQKPIFDSLFENLSKTFCTYDGVNSLSDLKMNGGYGKIGDEINTVHGSTSKLIQLLSKVLPKKVIKYNHEVTKICWQSSTTVQNRVFCKIKDNENITECEFLADHVIVTFPLGVLKKHHTNLFHPPLNVEKITAINRLGFGITNKIILYFDEPFLTNHSEDLLFVWKKIEANPPWWKTIITPHVIKDTVNNKFYICNFLAGKEAIEVEKLDDDVVARKCCEIFQTFLNLPEVPTPKFAYVTKWRSDPYAYGSYSYASVGSHAQDFEELAKPLPISDDASTPRVLFAGEATHSKYFSTVHGAFLTGLREAQRLIDLT